MKNAFISVFVRNNKEIQSLNGLRALAIIFILILHTKVVITTTQQNVPDIFLILLENLRSGVDLFFILSGFLISSGLYLNFKKDGKINYKNFYIKRSLRIFPAYYFYLLISFLIVSLQVNNLPEGSHERYLAEKGLQYVIYDFIYLTNYFPS
ncbi:MAG: acyltransferase, partial [Spirochaetia bacterium]|nr:acyltransferase [Spirochaetia bacterium]